MTQAVAAWRCAAQGLAEGMPFRLDFRAKMTS